MKKLSQEIEEILLDYLDGNLDPTKRETLEKALQEDADLRQRLEHLRKSERFLQQHVTPDTPSKNFTAIVMNSLDDYSALAGLNIRNGIFLLTGILIVMVMAIWLLSLGVFDHTSTTFNPNEWGVVQEYINQTLPSISIDGKLMVNIIVILNFGVMFLVLDRAILKPLFRRRLQGMH